jgi:hypothetical protein
MGSRAGVSMGESEAASPPLRLESFPLELLPWNRQFRSLRIAASDPLEDPPSMARSGYGGSRRVSRRSARLYAPIQAGEGREVNQAPVLHQLASQHRPIQYAVFPSSHGL